MGVGEVAFNPLRAIGSAESGKEVGPSPRRCQILKLRPGDSPSRKGSGLRVDLPARASPKHTAAPTRTQLSHPEKREGEKHAGKGVVCGSGP